MKKFTKLFLSCAAVAALTAAVATSAMAAEGDVDLKGGEITGTYNAGTLTLTAPNAADAFKTVVVLDAADVAADPNTVQIQSKNVIGIDQVTENTIVVKLDTAKVDADNKKYTVLVGGSAGEVYTATFGKGGVLLGDVTLDGAGTAGIDLDDASAIVSHYLEVPGHILTGDALIAADVDDAEGVDLDDASAIVQYYLELPGSYHVGETK